MPDVYLYEFPLESGVYYPFMPLHVEHTPRRDGACFECGEGRPSIAIIDLTNDDGPAHLVCARCAWTAA